VEIQSPTALECRSDGSPVSNAAKWYNTIIIKEQVLNSDENEYFVLPPCWSLIDGVARAASEVIKSEKQQGCISVSPRKQPPGGLQGTTQLQNQSITPLVRQ
jgi:hypothetical protein